MVSIDMVAGIAPFAACVPSAVIGLIVWRLEKKMDKRFQAQEQHERDREEYEVLSIQATRAAISLGEATALALKNGHTNGETDSALAYARDIKHQQTDFLTRQAAKSALR